VDRATVTVPDICSWLARVEPRLADRLRTSARRLEQLRKGGGDALLRRVMAAEVLDEHSAFRLSDSDQPSDTRALGCWLMTLVDGRERALSVLINLAEHDPDLGVRSAAVGSIGLIGGTRARAQLRAMGLQVGIPQLRIAALNALGLSGDASEQDTSILIRILGDPEESDDIAAETAVALGHIASRTPAVVACLVEALATRSLDVQRSSAVALGNIGDPTALEALRVAAEAPDAELRTYAANAIAAIQEASSGRQA